jgi:type I pantothenate kinase
VLVGIAGAVAVGKSTLAQALATALTPRKVEVVATDGFLRPNDELAPAGLLMQKGFPETYDTAAMAGFLEDLREGRSGRVPVYSHETYDIVAGAVREIAGAEVVILEGVNALRPEVAPHLDLRLYVDADEPVVRQWYVERFLGLIAAAHADPSSFYRRFLDLDDSGRRAMAVAVWEGVNLVNLTEHIAVTRAAADVIVRKAPDHSMTLVDASTEGQPS